jgi:hypothetical protein
MTIDMALAQLRHLYAQMLNEGGEDTIQAARDSIGPAIKALEITIIDTTAQTCLFWECPK